MVVVEVVCVCVCMCVCVRESLLVLLQEHPIAESAPIPVH